MPAPRTRIYNVPWFGFVYGAVVFATPIHILHLVYNRIPLVGDTLILWVTLCLLFGLPAAVATSVGAVASLLSTAEKRRRRAFFWGLTLYHLPLLELFVLFGLTYDQVPFFTPTTAIGMAAYVAVVAVGIGVGTLLVSSAVAAHLARRPRALRSPAVVLVLTGALASQIVLPIYHHSSDVPTPQDPDLIRPLRGSSRADHKVVFVGLDGADWRVIDPMLERGELPNLERLIREGTRAPLETIVGANSAGIWASIYSGKDLDRHRCFDFYRIRLPFFRGDGIYAFRRTFLKEAIPRLEKLGLASLRLVNRSCMEARPLWEILDDLRVDIGVVDGYLYSIPARPVTNEESFFFSYALNVLGPSESSSLAPDSVGGLVQPPEKISHYAPFRGESDFFWQSKTLLSLLDSGAQPDYLQLYSHEPDSEQHQFWKWYEPERFFGVRPVDVEIYGDRIRSLHLEIDRFLGELLEYLDDDTTLIIASDHGHSPTFLHPLHTQHRHGPPGILVLHGPEIGAGARLEEAHVLDVAPTILHLLGFPVARDFDGRVLEEAFVPGALDDQRPRTLDSYEPFGRDFDTGDIEDELNEKELDKLRAMGYIF